MRSRLAVLDGLNELQKIILFFLAFMLNNLWDAYGERTLVTTGRSLRPVVLDVSVNGRIFR